MGACLSDVGDRVEMWHEGREYDPDIYAQLLLKMQLWLPISV